MLQERKNVRLFGRIDVEDMAEAAIIRGDSLPKMDKLDYVSIQRLSETAVDNENMPALFSLAKINKYAVANSLNLENMISLGRAAGKGGVITPQLYFVMRGVLDVQRRKIFRRLARSSLLKLSLRIAGQGLRGDVPKLGDYQIGQDFDLEETMERILERYAAAEVSVLSPADIVGIEKRERQKNGVLLLDASGSMMGERNTNAGLAAAVMTYAMRHDRFSVIAFNTKAFVIKTFNEQVDVEEIIDRILDLEAVGYTNLEDALKRGAEQLKTIKTRFKWGILLTDGAFNKGKDPRYLAREFEKLHVINLPGKKWGQGVCRDLARLGGGRYVAVQRYQDVPRALMKVLRTPW